MSQIIYVIVSIERDGYVKKDPLNGAHQWIHKELVNVSI